MAKTTTNFDFKPFLTVNGMEIETAETELIAHQYPCGDYIVEPTESDLAGNVTYSEKAMQVKDYSGPLVDWVHDHSFFTDYYFELACEHGVTEGDFKTEAIQLTFADGKKAQDFMFIPPTPITVMNDGKTHTLKGYVASIYLATLAWAKFLLKAKKGFEIVKNDTPSEFVGYLTAMEGYAKTSLKIHVAIASQFSEISRFIEQHVYDLLGEKLQNSAT
ncbi:hypothetical protein GCM10011332_32500 [Terasakiella brassicae]|jgi:hypothetical protein|uniref:Uncharacterized protein n=1 Tax=Terasakiella brassicae TaxID=1634917 RepID=A0A917C7J9_9PROT|nr:hypothetical protein [Terasakiella brassicae]GGF76033.1 hypothetical protein GCM10011332_32500 [Terasakiella brassicae]